MKVEKKLNLNIIIQARFNSTRLKGKILKKINDKEILLIMTERLKKYKSNLIINISKKNPDKLINFCKKNKIKYFVGSDNNVLKRYYDCATKFKSKIIVRIPSDCPLIDPKIVEKGIRLFLNKRYSYISNIINPTFIDGNDVEIFNYKILKLINNKAKSKFDKEHVTTFLRRNLNRYKYKNFRSNKNLSKKYRYTLDYPEDLFLIRKIINKLGFYCNYSKICNFLIKNKKISKINKKYIGNMWYQKNF